MELSAYTTEDVHKSPVIPSVSADDLSKTNLSRFTINELDALYEAQLAVANAYALASNEPRVSAALHQLLADLSDKAETACEAIANAMKPKTSTDWWERKVKAHRLITHICRGGADMSEILGLSESLRQETDLKQ